MPVLGEMEDGGVDGHVLYKKGKTYPVNSNVCDILQREGLLARDRGP